MPKSLKKSKCFNLVIKGCSFSIPLLKYAFSTSVNFKCNVAAEKINIVDIAGRSVGTYDLIDNKVSKVLGQDFRESPRTPGHSAGHGSPPTTRLDFLQVCPNQRDIGRQLQRVLTAEVLGRHVRLGLVLAGDRLGLTGVCVAGERTEPVAMSRAQPPVSRRARGRRGQPRVQMVLRVRRAVRSRAPYE